MKRIVLALIGLVLVSLSASAKVEMTGSLKDLKGESYVQLLVEYQVIHGFTEEGFAEYEKDWYKDKPQVISYIIDAANEKLGDMVNFSYNLDCKYVAVLTITKVKSKGDCFGNLKFMDKEGNVIAEITGLEGEGGNFGSKLNLIKDGAKEIGKSIGKNTKKLLKRKD